MWVAPASRSLLEERLFRFLMTLRDGHAQSMMAHVAEPATLREIYAAPHPDLSAAFGHCLSALLIEMDSAMAASEKINVPAPIFGLALAVNNCLAPLIPGQSAARLSSETEEEPDEFTRALVATLRPARGLNAALAYHALLRGTSEAVTRISTERRALMHALIERSPLSALWSLDVHTPAALSALAAELLPGWQVKNSAQAYGWKDDDAWLKTIIKLLGNKAIARWVRRRWLMMPETRHSCRNMGLLIEALRRRGEHRAFILEFYEAYDYFCARQRDSQWQSGERFWPVLDEIEKLLRVPGESEAALQINRRGNEYFLKFRALVETVIAENGIPTDYALLSREFIQRLRPLLAFVTEGTRQRLSFGAVAFDSAAASSP